LEPFSTDNNWWWYFVQEQAPNDYTEQELEQWKNQKIKNFRNKIEEIIVPFSIVISNNEIADKFEASIFNNINFKQLPLKQEKNIQNIHKFLKETEELGKAHNLTMKLIDLAEAGHFKGLEHLSKKEKEDDEVFRTACYKIAKLLLEKKNEIEKENILSRLEEEINSIDKNKKMMELPIGDDKEKDKQIKVDGLEIKQMHKENEKNKIVSFMEKMENIDEIEIAIQSLRTVYARMKDGNNGNLSILVALVYYKLIDESKFNSFVDWIKRNRINYLHVDDDLSTHDENSLIMLFEKVYEAKRKEIFISMQFNDNQSEMIYEKIAQTVKRFNEEKELDIDIIPIRIDQTSKPSASTISGEILRAIDESSLLIADLSSCNVNVYHEIGYAMGIAKGKGIEEPHIILLYKEDTEFNKEKKDIDKFIGFNLRDISQLRFTTYKELTDGLMKRLEVYFEI
jgi:hypothetical protein